MAMTMFCYSRYRMYWSTNPLIKLPLVAEVMPLKRFEQLRRYIHFTDNSTIPERNKDIFIKIWTFCKRLNETFAKVATPTENIAGDEMLIPFKGWSRVKQYIKQSVRKGALMIGLSLALMAMFPNGWNLPRGYYWNKCRMFFRHYRWYSFTSVPIVWKSKSRTLPRYLFTSIPFLKELLKKDIHVSQLALCMQIIRWKLMKNLHQKTSLLRNKEVHLV